MTIELLDPKTNPRPKFGDPIASYTDIQTKNTAKNGRTRIPLFHFAGVGSCKLVHISTISSINY